MMMMQPPPQRMRDGLRFMGIGGEITGLVVRLSVLSSLRVHMIFIIKPDSTAELRLVRVGRAVNDRTVIAEGLAAGEHAVVDGELRLNNGTRVAIRQPAGAPTQPLPALTMSLPALCIHRPVMTTSLTLAIRRNQKGSPLVEDRPTLPASQERRRCGRRWRLAGRGRGAG
jgi:hypothetical protein